MKETVAHWVNERWKLYLAKEDGKVYTSPDFRMNQYRFCNVHREHDYVSRALRTTWMKRGDNQDDLPYVAYLARRINQAKLFTKPRPTDFSFEALSELMGEDKYINKAYRVNGVKGLKTGQASAHFTSQAALIPIRRTDTLADMHEQLLTLPQVGSFFSGQMIGDLKNTLYLAHASDWYTWATPGPGSMRGLNKYYGRPEDESWAGRDFLSKLHQMEEEVTPLLLPMPRIGAQDWQNVMCEYDKYLRFYDEPNTGKPYKSNNK